jgi:hypothetical protein
MESDWSTLCKIAFDSQMTWLIGSQPIGLDFLVIADSIVYMNLSERLSRSRVLAAQTRDFEANAKSTEMSG